MPATFRFVHAADLHLDAPPLGLHRAPSAVLDAVCRAPLAAWEALVRLTIEQHAAFLLLAGDVCDGGERAVAAQQELVRGLQRLSDRGIQTFIVRGPADPSGRWAGINAWPAGVHCLGSTDVEAVAVHRGGERLATVHAFGAAVPAAVRALAGAASTATNAGLPVGLLHANIDVEPGEPSRLSLQDLKAAGMGYWALGHDHRRRHLTAGPPLIVYPGTLQGRGFAEAETGPKGAEVVQVQDGAAVATTFHPLDSVRMVTADVEVKGTIADTCRALGERAAALRAEHAERGLVIRAGLHGHRPPSGDWATDPRARLLNDLRRQSADARPFAWWDTVLDATRVQGAEGSTAAAAVRHALTEKMQSDQGPELGRRLEEAGRMALDLLAQNAS